MKLRFKIFFIFLFLVSFHLTQGLQAQVLRVMPQEPLPTESVTIIFDATQGNAALRDFDGTVYFHSGIITDASRDEKDWKFATGDWGKADKKMAMKAVGDNLYEATFVPNDFYSIPEGVRTLQMAFVFRNEDGSKVGKSDKNTDIYLPFKGYVPVETKSPTYLFTKKVYKGFTQKEGCLFVETSEGTIAFRPFSDSIVEVSWHPQSFEDFYPSHAVILKPAVIEPVVSETPSMLIFDMKGIQVLIQKNPFAISYLTNGHPFLKEEKGFFKRSDASGVRFKLEVGEKLYGSGGRASGLNLRGQMLGLYNRPDYNYEFGANNLNYMIPTLLSSENYMLFVDNPSKGWFDADSKGDGVLEFGAESGPMRYFLITGKNPAAILKQYASLTGKQPLLPRWAYGNLQSRMAYRTQTETEAIVESMIAKDFPIDAIILDFYWFGDSILGHLGRLDWWKPSWPAPEKMIQKFKSKGIRTITISEPYIIDSLANWREADALGILVTDSLRNSYVDKQFYFGPGSLIDIFKPEAQDWLWKQYRKQYDIGIEGLWGDLGEPESHPADIHHVWGKANEVHNIYGHYWTKMIADRFKKDFPNKRLFFLARSGYAGTQHYGIVPWSGDVSRSWGGLKAQLPAMLNMSLSGIPYMHSDAGGFATGLKDDELYTRWLQFAVFTPILRPHGSGIPSEPIFFNDTTQRIVRHFMKLRYEMLPYIYTTAWQTAQTGIPIVRPMLWQNTNDRRFSELFSQYYFGNDLLVCPVTEVGQLRMDVELPSGLWYHFWTGRRYVGGESVTLQLARESIPVFVRGGSIIPRVPAFNQTDAYTSCRLFLHSYLPEGEAAFNGQLYEDDGESRDAYSSGDFELLHFDGQVTNGSIRLELQKSGNGYAGMPETRLVEVVLYGLQKKLKEVRFDAKALSRLQNDPIDENETGFWLDSQGQYHIRFQWFGNKAALIAY